MSDWLSTFGTALPDEYVCREFRREDGILEGIEIDHPIIGGTLLKSGVPAAYAGVNLIAGRHWVFFYIKDDEVRKHGLWVLRLMRDSMVMLKNAGITELYGLLDESKPHAIEFIKKLGFKPVSVYDRTVDMIVYEKLMGSVNKTWRRVEGEK